MTMKRHCHNCRGYEKGICKPRRLRTRRKSTCKLFIQKNKRGIPERPSVENCENAPDCAEAGVKTCVNCVRLKNAQEAWDREFG